MRTPLAADFRDVTFLEEDERRVTGNSADTSEATKFSLLPMPTRAAHRRAPMSVSGIPRVIRERIAPEPDAARPRGGLAEILLS